MHTIRAPSYIHIWSQFIEVVLLHNIVKRNSYQVCAATTVSCCRSYIIICDGQRTFTQTVEMSQMMWSKL